MNASTCAGPASVVSPPVQRRSSLQVFSARIDRRLSDPDVFDVTRGTGGSAGEPFAPSESILRPALRAREMATKLRRDADDLTIAPTGHQRASLLLEADELEARAWELYRPAFIAEMRASWKRHRSAWDALLARPRVALACFCVLAPPPAEQRCHRVLLRAVILPALGATDRGEIGAAS